MTKKNQGTDYSQLLIWSAAIVTVVRYAAAFIASDLGEITGWLSDVVTVAMGFSGLGMGILDVIGGTYLFDGWRRNMPRADNKKGWSSRFKALTFFVFALMTTGVLILIPFTVSRVTHQSMAVVLGSGVYLNFWALLVNIAPYLLIGGVAVGNNIVTVQPGHLPETGGHLSENKKASDNKLSESDRVNVPSDWRLASKKLSDEEKRELINLSTDKICYKYGLEARTARRWREKAAEELASSSPPPK
jgi:hypothetical protein